MKVLIINTFDYGGAANSCKRLHLGLVEAGINSKVLLKNKARNWPESFQFKAVERTPGYKEKLRKLAQKLKLYKKNDKMSDRELFLNSRTNGLEMFSFPDSHFDITQSVLYQEADIINLHWVANFLDFKSFFNKNTKPVVWTLHDMNPFTGGEHYEEKFLGIDNNGRAIPRKLSKTEKEISAINKEIKKKIFSKIDKLTIVSPSKWLANESKKSGIFGKFDTKYIPYGLDSEIFQPRDRVYSRELLNLPKEKKVILFVADSLNNSRKGFIFLKKALEKLKDENLFLCAIGKTGSNINSENIIELGKIQDERLMSMAYSAADVFVIPSLIDNLPNTVLESLMCGTPVIGFPVGGIPEMIVHGENGLLAKDISANSLAETLTEFLCKPEKFNRNTIREDAVAKFDYRIQVEKYVKLYNEIVSKN